MSCLFIREELKMSLGKIKNFEDLLCDIINMCLLMYDQKKYLSPVEKHMLVNVMAFSLFLLDNEKAAIQAISIYKLDKEKKIKITKLDKVFFDLKVMSLSVMYKFVHIHKVFDSGDPLVWGHADEPLPVCEKQRPV